MTVEFWMVFHRCPEFMLPHILYEFRGRTVCYTDQDDGDIKL